MDRLHPHLLSILRIVAAFSFITHGTQKLFHFPGGAGMHITLMSQFGVAGLIETIGGVLLLIGLFARPVAFVACGEMAVAFWTVHFPRGHWPITNGGELATLYCAIWLYIAVVGPGAWSLDAIRTGGRGRGRTGRR
jgi:putative oxidoreductase